MSKTEITPKNQVTGTSIDLSTIDIDRALQRGRHLRAQAFTSALKALFRNQRAERDDRKGGLSPDCVAPA